jgi:hypothetical protein
MCRESNAGNQVPVRVSTKRSESRSNAFSLLCDTAAENHPVTTQAADGKVATSDTVVAHIFDLPRTLGLRSIGWGGTSGHGDA